MFGVCCLLFDFVCCVWLFVVRCLLLVGCCLVFGARCLPLVVCCDCGRCLLCDACYSLFVVCRLFFVVCYQLCVVC